MSRTAESLQPEIVIGVTNRTTALSACTRGLIIARATNARVHLVYAIDGRDPQGESIAHRHAEGLLEALALSSSVPVTIHVVQAEAHTAILQVARSTSAELIVIGNQGLTKHGRFTRATPARVLRGATCSVLVVDTSPVPIVRH